MLSRATTICFPWLSARPTTTPLAGTIEAWPAQPPPASRPLLTPRLAKTTSELALVEAAAGR